jgi:hypothetical protein
MPRLNERHSVERAITSRNHGLAAAGQKPGNLLRQSFSLRFHLREDLNKPVSAAFSIRSV